MGDHLVSLKPHKWESPKIRSGSGEDRGQRSERRQLPSGQKKADSGIAFSKWKINRVTTLCTLTEYMKCSVKCTLLHIHKLLVYRFILVEADMSLRCHWLLILLLFLCCDFPIFNNSNADGGRTDCKRPVPPKTNTCTDLMTVFCSSHCRCRRNVYLSVCY